MPSRPLVSVIVPTFNRSRSLSRAIDSALAQTYSPIEVIVVDDGSTDDTERIVRARYGAESRVQYFHQKNRGASAARNAAVDAGKGEYLALLDSDDFWEPWKTELQMACMLARPEIGMTWTDMAAVDARGEVISQDYMREMYGAYARLGEDEPFSSAYPIEDLWPDAPPALANRRLFSGYIYSQMILGNLVTTPTVILTRERFARAGRFDETLLGGGEDYEFHLRTCREGPVGFIDVASARVSRLGNDHLSRGNQVRIARNFLITIEAALEKDRERIQLSAARIHSVLGEAHGWLGNSLIAHEKNVREGRRHLRQSLRHAFGKGAMKSYARSFVPIWLIEWLRRRKEQLSAAV